MKMYGITVGEERSLREEAERILKDGTPKITAIKHIRELSRELCSIGEQDRGSVGLRESREIVETACVKVDRLNVAIRALERVKQSLEALEVYSWVDLKRALGDGRTFGKLVEAYDLMMNVLNHLPIEYPLYQVIQSTFVEPQDREV